MQLDIFQGEYRVYYKAFLRCQIKSTNDIQLNFYLSKKTANTTEIKGNVTFNKPFDDSFNVSSL